MFSVTVTERGEPPETFEFRQPEITIGRVRGNDILLRKGSVSKLHAKLVHKDGRFVLVDLRSTNGTVVNGRKIGAPHTVREGDKIVIGDYVLEVAPGRPDGALTPARTSAARSGLDDRTPPPEERGETEGGAALPVAAPAGSGRAPRPHTAAGSLAAPATPTIERASAESAAPRAAALLVGDPRFADAHRATIDYLLAAIDPLDLPGAYPPTPAERDAAEELVRGAPGSLAGALAREPDFVRLVVDEIAGAGPVDLYLDDPSVTEVRVVAHDRILLQRGATRERALLGFASAMSLTLAARRIAAGAGITDPSGGSVRLSDGTRVEIVLPHSADGEPALLFARPRPGDHAVAIPAPLLDVLRTALAHQGCVLVSASHQDDASAFVGALLAALPDETTVVAVESHRSLGTTGAALARLTPVEGASRSALQRAALLTPDLIVADSLAGDASADWLFHAAPSGSAFLAIAPGRGPHDALCRLVAHASHATGIEPATLRRLVARAADLVVVLQHRRGQVAITEVIDVAGLCDDQLHLETVFRESAASPGAPLSATGHVPRLFDELRAAGHDLPLHALKP